MTDIKENQARLKNLGSGDLLPFEADDLVRDESRSQSRSKSDFQTSGIIAPKGVTGVSIKGRKNNNQQQRSQNPQTPASGNSPGYGPAFAHRDREESLSRSGLTLDASISGLAPANSSKLTLPDIEVLHVGIDNSSGLKIIRQERESVSLSSSHHLVPSSSSLPPVVDDGGYSPEHSTTKTPEHHHLRPESQSRSVNSTPSLSGSEGTGPQLPPITEDELPLPPTSATLGS